MTRKLLAAHIIIAASISTLGLWLNWWSLQNNLLVLILLYVLQTRWKQAKPNRKGSKNSPLEMAEQMNNEDNEDGGGG